MKKTLSVLSGIFILFSYAFADEVTVSVDSGSTYTPTNIINGSFEDGLVSYSTETAAIHPGTDKGWGTTDTYGFERSSNMGTYGWSSYTPAAGSCFVEMNNHYASILYQDLTTYPNDVIRWTLAHAARTGCEETQTIHVDIGKSDGNYPSGYAYADSDSNIVSSKNAHIDSSTMGEYTTSGVSGYNCYANLSELAALSVTQTATSTDYSSKCWYKATGIYIIPEGQTVTRFAFISDCTNPKFVAAGNLLDDITFSTLIGNLNAYAEWDSSVVVTGYWGETDTSKKLIVKTGDTPNEVDMSSVTGKNFKIVIPASIVGSSNSVTIYHQDYSAAAKTVSIERHYHGSVLYGVWNYSNTLPSTGRYALAQDVTLSGDITLTGSADMVSYGGAKICLNGHTITGGKIIINASSNAVTIECNNDTENAGSIPAGITVTSGTFTAGGLSLPSLTVNGGTCILTGLTEISLLTLGSGQKITIGEDLSSSSEITLCSSPETGVITSGFGSYALGTIINLPAGQTGYMLLKDKNGELKVSTHK